MASKPDAREGNIRARPLYHFFAAKKICMSLPENFQQRLIEALRERGANANCEICGKNNWAIVDQAVSVQVTDLSGAWSIPPPQIPAAGMVCNHCGNIRLFALGVLGLLPTAPVEGRNDGRGQRTV